MTYATMAERHRALESAGKPTMATMGERPGWKPPKSIYRAFRPELKQTDLPPGIIGQIAGIALVYDEIDTRHLARLRGVRCPERLDGPGSLRATPAAEPVARAADAAPGIRAGRSARAETRAGGVPPGA